MTFNDRQNLLFYYNPNSIKVNLPTHICLRRNCQLCFILTHWSCSKCRDILHTLNVFRVPTKEHQVVDCWATDEILVLETLFCKCLEYATLILRKYKKVERTKIIIFTIFSFLSTQYVLETIPESFSEKQRSFPLI